MKNIIKSSMLLVGILASVIPTVSIADTVGSITFAGDATLTPNQLTFADNSTILTSSLFSGGRDTSGNLLPNLGLNGPVTIQPIQLSPLETMGEGRPSTISPLIADSVYFYPQNPGEDGINLISGTQQFTGATFRGEWRVPVSSGTYLFPGPEQVPVPSGTYVFPGEVSISAQGVPGNQSFSISGLAFSPVEFIEDDSVIIPEPSTVLSSLLGLGFMLLYKK